MNKLRSNLEQNIGWIVLLILLLGCLLVLRPFVSALLWAVVLCFSSWPLYRRLLGLLGNHRTLAAFLMTLAMILIVLLPFIIRGARGTASWQGLTEDPATIWTQAQQFIKPVSSWLLHASLALGSGLMQLT